MENLHFVWGKSSNKMAHLCIIAKCEIRVQYRSPSKAKNFRLPGLKNDSFDPSFIISIPIIYIYMFKIRCPINPYHLLKCPWGFKLSAWLCRNRKALNHDPWYPLGAETNIPLEGASQSVNEQPGILVGGIPTPLNNIKVSRDDSSQYMEKKMFQTTNQIYIYSIPPVRPTGYT